MNTRRIATSLALVTLALLSACGVVRREERREDRREDRREYRSSVTPAAAPAPVSMLIAPAAPQSPAHAGLIV